MWPLRSGRQRRLVVRGATERIVGRAMGSSDEARVPIDRRAGQPRRSDGQRMVIRGSGSRRVVRRRREAMGMLLGEVYSGAAPDGADLGGSQATRAIRTAALGVGCPRSTGGLSTGWSLPALQEARSLGSVHLGACFPLRCVQRLSQPFIATRRCPWQDSRDTSGTSDPVLSY